MKKIFNRYLANVLLAALITSSVKGQYYKTTKRNVLFLNTNSLSLYNAPVLFSTIEAGKEIRRFYCHGGFGLHYLINSFEKSNADIHQSGYAPISFYSIGGDVKVVSFAILNLSKKSYCKILGGALRIGTDINKNTGSTYNNGYGYRFKAYFEFYISKSGSNKYDIGWHKAVQLGYTYSSLAAPINPYNSLMLNFLIIKHHVYKFAEWY